MTRYTVSGRHALIMLLCCIIPLAAIFLVAVLGIPLSTLATVAILLLCPLLHILMMRGMAGHGSHGSASCHQPGSEPTRTLPAGEVAGSQTRQSENAAIEPAAAPDTAPVRR